jgi:hypothetical protein
MLSSHIERHQSKAIFGFASLAQLMLRLSCHDGRPTPRDERDYLIDAGNRHREGDEAADVSDFGTAGRGWPTPTLVQLWADYRGKKITMYG